MTDEDIAAIRDKAIHADRECVVCRGTDFRFLTVDADLPIAIRDGEIRAVNTMAFACTSCGWLALHTLPPWPRRDK